MAIMADYVADAAVGSGCCILAEPISHLFSAASGWFAKDSDRVTACTTVDVRFG